MRAGLMLGLLTGLCAGFALGWLLKAPEERAGPGPEVKRGPVPVPDAGDPLVASREPETQAPREATPASPEPASASRADPPVLVGHDGGLTWTDPGWARAALVRSYRKLSGGLEMPVEDLDTLGRQLEGSLTAEGLRRTAEGWAQTYARNVWERESVRLAEGTLTDPPTAVFQDLGYGATMELASPPERTWDPHRSREPLQLAPPPADPEARRYYVRGGLVPRGRAFLIEAIEVDIRSAELASGPRAVRVSLPSGEDLHIERVGRGQRLRFEGLVPVHEHDEERVQVQGAGECASEVRLSGRLVEASDPKAGAHKPFVLVRFEGDGYLTGAPVLLQLRGGGDDGLTLDGVFRGRTEGVQQGDLWDESAAFEEERPGKAHVEGAGVPPPGKAFEITRVTYRALLARGTCALAIGPETIERPNREDLRGREGRGRQRYEGTWTGSYVVHGHEENTVGLRLRKGGLVEARIEGRLVDAPPR